MSQSCPVAVDHHQFVVGAQAAETYEPTESGSVMEVGPNFVTVKTGVAYGPVTLTVAIVDSAPSESTEGSGWEVIEEADVQITKAIHVLGLDGERTAGFDRVAVGRGRYRCRVSGEGRDEHWDLEVSEPSESYLVQLWKVARPTPMTRLHKSDKAFGEDIVVHPGRNWWDPDPAADATIALRYGYEQVAQWAKDKARRWGGRPPTDKIRGLNRAEEFAYLDRALVDAIARTREPKLRNIAVWAAHRACATSRADQIDWVRTALVALTERNPLPEPFGSTDRYALADHITESAGDNQHAVRAMYSIQEALHREPLQAVFTTLGTAVDSPDDDHAHLIADLRARFFPKLMPADQYERWI
ncbi:transposase [Nocardia sp. NPDC058640]|uniref:transposase n=1 Tax=Nocardia sp. NPDC058640 TaxID=3346571 RepID=UPI003657DDBE